MSKVEKLKDVEVLDAFNPMSYGYGSSSGSSGSSGSSSVGSDSEGLFSGDAQCKGDKDCPKGMGCNSYGTWPVTNGTRCENLSSKERVCEGSAWGAKCKYLTFPSNKEGTLTYPHMIEGTCQQYTAFNRLFCSTLNATPGGR